MTVFLPIPSNPQPNTLTKDAAAKDAAIRETAQKLEATFIAEMLKSAGVGAQDNSFSGSAGEDHFASFQREAMAKQMVSVGGIGLAEAFYNSMMETRT